MNKKRARHSVHAGTMLMASLAGVLALEIGCAESNLAVVSDSDGASTADASEPLARGQSPTGITGKGSFVVRYLPPKSPKLREMAKVVKESELLTDVLPDLNGNFSLEQDLPIVFRECRQENAYYDPRKRQVSICYEFVRYLAVGFAEVYANDEDGDEALQNAITFFLFHEIGHALIDIDNLPITGGSEAAADEFAAFVLMSLGDDGKLIVLHAAVAFSRIVGKGDSLDDSTLGDEHLLGRQRALNLICLAYGASPEEKDIKDAALTIGMPPSRLARCAEEYDRISVSWLTLLQPHLKQTAAAGR